MKKPLLYDTSGEGLARVLDQALDGKEAEEVLRTVIQDLFPGRLAISSSFGTEAAPLLEIVSRIDRSTPVIMLDTGKLFPETLAYMDLLVDRLRLTDVRVARPQSQAVEAFDSEGDLHQKDHDACCAIRKVAPLEEALKGFDAWVTGRKRHHGGDRGDLPTVEFEDGRVKVNPLAHWDSSMIQDAFDNRALPMHPLVFEGYSSVGCAVCTTPTGAAEDPRAGRWRGQAKTECGIHKARWSKAS